MRIAVHGETVTAIALRGLLSATGRYVICHVFPQFVIELREGPAPHVVIDGVDSPLEAKVVSRIAELLPTGKVELQRGGGNQDDARIAITVPAGDVEASHAVEFGIFRALEQLQQPKGKRWWLLGLMAWLLIPSPASAQINARVIARFETPQAVTVSSGTITTITNPVTVTDGAGALNVIVDSGTVTANQGTNNATPWNENVAQVGGGTVTTVATGTQKVGVADSGGNAIASATTTALDGTGRGLEMRGYITQRAGTGVAFSAACGANIDACAANSTATVTLDNYFSASFYLAAGTLAATLVCDYSVNGSNWIQTYCIDGTSRILSVVLTNPNAAHVLSVPTPGGASKMRVRVSAYTSGNATATGYANWITDPFAIPLCTQGEGVSFTANAVVPCIQGGYDAGGLARAMRLTNTTVSTSEYGVVVRANEVTPGTLAANLGKAEDSVATSADTGVAMLGVADSTNATQRAADRDYTQITTDTYGTVLVRSDHPNRLRCTQTISTAVILTVMPSCTAPGAGLSIYITDILFSTNVSAIAADSFPTLKYGTGGACGTGTTVFWGAFTAAGVQATVTETFTTPIKIPANNEVCWINTGAGSRFVVLSGFIAP